MLSTVALVLLLSSWTRAQTCEQAFNQPPWLPASNCYLSNQLLFSSSPNVLSELVDYSQYIPANYRWGKFYFLGALSDTYSAEYVCDDQIYTTTAGGICSDSSGGYQNTVNNLNLGIWLSTNITQIKFADGATGACKNAESDISVYLSAICNPE